MISTAYMMAILCLVIMTSEQSAVEGNSYLRETLKVRDPYKKVDYPNRHLKAKGGKGGGKKGPSLSDGGADNIF